jgi:hypothetical protein
MPAILATWEAKLRRITVSGQPQQKKKKKKSLRDIFSIENLVVQLW